MFASLMQQNKALKGVAVEANMITVTIGSTNLSVKSGQIGLKRFEMSNLQSHRLLRFELANIVTRDT